MLEDVRDLLMKRLAFNRTLSQKWWEEFCPDALKRLETAKKKVGDCIPSPANDHMFQVLTIHALNTQWN